MGGIIASYGDACFGIRHGQTRTSHHGQFSRQPRTRSGRDQRGDRSIESAICGALVPPEFTASIVGIYERVANLILEDDRGSYLVSLVTDLDDWTEFSIVVTPAFLAQTVALGIGARLTTTHGGDFGAPNAPRVRLLARGEAPPPPTAGRALSPPHNKTTRRKTPPVTAEVSAPPSLPVSPPVCCSTGLPSPAPEIAASCREELQRHYPATGFVPLLELGSRSARDNPFVVRAEALLREEDPAALVGLGAGLTPSGDDFLSGMLLAEDVAAAAAPGHPLVRGKDDPSARSGASQPQPTRKAPRLQRESIERSLHRTTPAGATLLRLALAGYPPAYQLAMIDTLAAGEIDRTIAIASRHGHSSGLDALAGFLFAFDIVTGSV